MSQFEKLFNKAAIPLCLVNKKLTTLKFNTQFEKTFGYTQEEVPTLNEWWRLAYPDPIYRKWAIDTCDAALQRAVEANTDIEPIEYRVTCKNGDMRTMVVFGSFVGDDLLLTFFDVTDRKQMEQERLSHLRFLENMDSVNRAIQANNDLEQMMSDVLDEVLSIFDCDRAFLLYPCDPEGASWSAPMERTKPEHPGAHAVGLEAPMDPDVAKVYRLLLESDGPVKFGPDYVHPLPQEMSRLFGYKSQILMALYPKRGAPWAFGLHQCSHPRVWTIEEERLFQEIGHRLEDALTGLRMYRNLQDSEERYRLVFENSPIPIWEEDFSGVKTLFDDLRKAGVTDLETHLAQQPESLVQFGSSVKVVDVNQAAVALHAAANKEQLLAGFTDIIAADSLDELRKELISLWNGKTTMTFDSSVKTFTGDVRTVTVFFTVCPGHEETLARTFASIVDITKRVQAEAALKDSEARYVDLYENAPDMYVSVNARTASVERCNQRLADMLGRPKEEIIDRPVFEIYHPDCVDQAKEVFQEFLERGEVHDKELQLKRRDGSKLDVSLNVTSIRDDDGHILFSRSILRDITEHKRTDNIMQTRLRLLEFANSHSMDELLTATLDEMEALTGSSIGFYHFLEADQKTLSLQNWSTNTLKNMCTAAGKGSHYDIAQAGVWVDCVHTRRAVIHNDYASLPHRKGMPEGHAPVIRELVVPIFRRDLIRAIVGIGNKPADYDESDVEIISQLGDLSWDIVERMQAEEALQESERTHRELFENSTDFVFTLDLKGRFTSVNRAAEDLTGYTKNELIGMSYKEYAPEDTHERIFRAFSRVFNEGEPLKDFPLEVIIKDGTKRYFETCVSPLRKGEETIGFQGSSRDVTERKLAEDALRRSEEEKTALNQIANVFLTVPDEAMYGEVLAVVLQVMKSTFGIFGYMAENGDLIIPSLTREIWNECQVPGKSIVFPADSWGNSLWGRAIKEKKAFCSDGPFHSPEGHIHIEHFLAVPIVYGQETIGLISAANKEGGYAEEDRDLLERIASRISPILHARLQRDIQERGRMAAEKNLKESEEKYRLLITNAGEAIFIVQDGVVKFPNPKALEMIGYSAEELAETPFVDLIHPGDKDTVLEVHLRLQEGGRRPEASPFRIIDKRGKEMWVQLTTAPIIWEKKPGILCFLRDVTEEKKLEAQFVQAQKMEAVGRLAGGVAHDFNNMLTLIIGHTDLALNSIDPSDPLHSDLREIDRAARGSADLTRQLLAFARKQTVSPRILDLNDTVSSMLKMLRRLIGEDIDLVWKPGAELWPIEIDPGQIDQVLANLCINARDAITGAGNVTIETRNVTLDETYCADHAGLVAGEYVLLAVSDDGCGMDAETQAHLFEPFFTTKGVGEGTGLGLATVYGIVKQNQGYIKVHSEVGQGTTFEICLPPHKAESAHTVAESADEAPPRGKETVLMVEDEKAILDLGKRILGQLGYTVLIADTPEEAIRLVEEHTGDIHLLLTDVVMPQMTGQDLAARLGSIKPDLKCLYISGYTADAITHRGVLEKGIHLMEKPFSGRDLAVKVREVLDQKLADTDGE